MFFLSRQTDYKHSYIIIKMTILFHSEHHVAHWCLSINPVNWFVTHKKKLLECTVSVPHNVWISSPWLLLGTSHPHLQHSVGSPLYWGWLMPGITHKKLENDPSIIKEKKGGWNVADRWPVLIFKRLLIDLILLHPAMSFGLQSPSCLA